MMQLVCLSVKADNKADYLKLAQKVRQEVWDNTPVDFKKRAVPEKFKKESAVILSYYKEPITIARLRQSCLSVEDWHAR